MEDQVKEKVEGEKKGKGVTMYLKDIPRSVHNKIKRYRTDLIGQHRRSFTLKEAYVEFIKQHSSTIK